ncbi:hypothetical protein AAZX31_08G233200 [Glycine max]
MNIISYNVRGLGRGVKWPAIKKLVIRHNIDMICLQETKKETIDKSTCQALWGDSDVNWEAQPATNSAGEILCIWSNKNFKLERKVQGPGFIMLEGKWHQEAQIIHITNIYSPCDIQNKRVLWAILTILGTHVKDSASITRMWGKETLMSSMNGSKSWR